VGVLAALHDVNQAAEFCDHLVLLHAGRVLVQGTPEEVLQPEPLRVAYQADTQIGTNPITGRPMLLALRPKRSGFDLMETNEYSRTKQDKTGQK
jgi:iron complex transport system ATP-binding protein